MHKAVVLETVKAHPTVERQTLLRQQQNWA